MKKFQAPPSFSKMLICGFLVLMSAFASFAQTTSGSVAGGVTDQQQAAVSGATVTIKDEAKGVIQTATTDR